MNVEYDGATGAANIARHGLSLADATLMNLLTTAVSIDDPGYAEPRFGALQRIDGVGYCLAFAVRGAVVRPISFRRAHDKERKRQADKPIVVDNDNPQWSDEDVARARPGAKVLPAELVSALKRGRPRSSGRQQVTLRLPFSVIEHYAGCQTRAVAVLEREVRIAGK